MNVIVGLGNPGEKYRKTRHNAGLNVVAGLARGHRVRLRAGLGDFLSGGGRVSGREVELVLPLTYMNTSGRAVADALSSGDREPHDLLVVCDDVNLPLGRLRLRADGSDGGHNGLASIISVLGTERFARLRLGVGGAPQGVDLADYVLEPFEPRQLKDVEEMMRRGVEALEFLLARGIESAMNEYNRRPAGEEPAGA